MNKDEKEIKTTTLDLAKTLSYLTELQKTNNQNYVTPEGISLLEGVVIAGTGKVKVVPLNDYESILNENYKLKEKLRNRKKYWF